MVKIVTKDITLCFGEISLICIMNYKFLLK